MIAGARDWPAIAAFARKSRVALIHQLVNCCIVCGDLLLDCTSAVRILGGHALQLRDPFLRRDHIGMAVIVLRLGRSQRGFRRGKCGIAIGRPSTLRNELPILVLERGDLGAEAAGIDQRRCSGVCESRAVPGLECRQLTLEIGDLPLELGRLVLEETHREGRLVFNVGAVHAEEFGDEALQDSLGLGRVAIVIAHRDRDRIVLASRLLADIARQGTH